MKRSLLPLLLLLSACQTPVSDGRPPVQPVAAVDLQRYVGIWFEIARLPMPFQRQCIGDTTAEYRLRDDGTLSVLNRCRTATGFDEASAQAAVVEGSQNARLKVSFFWPFRADYWIIGLDADYRWALVGDPKRRYLWILARASQLAQAELDAARAAAQAQGYDLTPLIYGPHSAGN